MALCCIKYHSVSSCHYLAFVSSSECTQSIASWNSHLYLNCSVLTDSNWGPLHRRDTSSVSVFSLILLAHVITLEVISSTTMSSFSAVFCPFSTFVHSRTLSALAFQLVNSLPLLYGARTVLHKNRSPKEVLPLSAWFLQSSDFVPCLPLNTFVILQFVKHCQDSSMRRADPWDCYNALWCWTSTPKSD